MLIVVIAIPFLLLGIRTIAGSFCNPCIVFPITCESYCSHTQSILKSGISGTGGKGARSTVPFLGKMCLSNTGASNTFNGISHAISSFTFTTKLLVSVSVPNIKQSKSHFSNILLTFFLINASKSRTNNIRS